MSEWTIYWWTRLDSIGTALTIMAIFGAIGAGVTAIIGVISKGMGSGYGKDDEDNKRAYGCLQAVIKILWVIVPVWVLAVFVPSSKEFAMMKVIPKLANSEISQQIQKDMPEIYTMAKDALKEMIAPKKTEAKQT